MTAQSSSKVAGSLDLAPKGQAPSVARLFLDRVAAQPNDEAFRAPSLPSEEWYSLTWSQTEAKARSLAGGLLALGLDLEERVAIASTTRLEWILADLAVMLAGGATTTVYPSTQHEDVAYILGDSGSQVVFAEDQSQAAKIAMHRNELPAIRKVILFDGEGDGDWQLSMADFVKLGDEFNTANPTAVDDRVAKLAPDNIATLIYTSGTTGRPKGVILTHGNWTYEGAAIEALQLLRKDHLHFLWLPLSHSFGKVLLSAQLQIGLVTAVDGRVDKIVSNLSVVRPSVMAAAPRIFEKVYTTIVSMTEAEGGVKSKIFSRAFDVGQKAATLERDGKSVGRGIAVQRAVADKLVFSKIRDRLGGRAEYFVSGSAALSRPIAEWFHAAGLLILEGYGLTETSAATCVNRPKNFRFGTVGEPLPGTEIKIAEDGEILVRGPGVMRGYHNLPEQTAEVMIGDGWFATGDVGEIDEGGRVRITDRKKDLMKTSGGKYLAPSAIESAFKAACPIASQMVVYVGTHSYATALVTLDPDALKTWAEGQGITGTDTAALATGPEARAYVESAVKELNAGLNKWETIKDFRILPRDFTIEDGELTPSLKVKRKVVETNYAEILESMYSK
jgi:long-chain acyl-CoA synthetase